MYRIGNGYDAHRFEEGKALVLGGVTIPYEKGLKAHSDGDVILHAVCDALLGAAGLGDIGQHFPDSDPQYANLDSRKFLCHIAKQVRHENYVINNVDITILAQAPRLSGYLAQMRVNLAADLGVTTGQVNLKATTTEEMGFVGRKEGIACYAVALIRHMAD